MKEGERADTAIFAAGLAPSRTAARHTIEEGRAFIGGVEIEKPSQIVDNPALLTVRSAPEYVSRGAYKLLGAMEAFCISAEGCVCADIGASTGGFTQVLLNAGAARVYAIDVGTNQLAPSLRKDERVVVMENTNARYLTAESLPEPVKLITYDVSFISASLLYPAMRTLLAPGGLILGLIKPQFEAGREAIGKGGIVKHPRDHERAICSLIAAARQSDLSLTGLMPSPIRGGDGNIEYLARIECGASQESVSDERVAQTVRIAFESAKDAR